MASEPRDTMVTNASTLQGPRECHAYTALNEIRRVIQDRHPNISITLPPTPKFTDILRECTKALAKVDSTISVPAIPTPPQSSPRRARLRRTMMQIVERERERAREREAPQQQIHNRPSVPVHTDSKPIHAHDLLRHAGLPRQLSQSERGRIRERLRAFDKENPPGNRWLPFVLVSVELQNALPVVTCTAQLPAVTCTLQLSAMDHGSSMPQESIRDVTALWDTAAKSVFITDDILSPEFRSFLQTNPVHDPYRVSLGTRVQISCLVEFSNKIVQLDTYAIVLPVAAVPNGRSGVILGQLDLINSIRYESAPRDILGAEGVHIPEKSWGTFDLRSFVDADGGLHSCDDVRMEVEVETTEAAS